jgi:hypothetical protein
MNIDCRPVSLEKRKVHEPVYTFIFNTSLYRNHGLPTVFICIVHLGMFLCIVLLVQIHIHGDQLDRVIIIDDFENGYEKVVDETRIDELIQFGQNTWEIELIKRTDFIDTYLYGEVPPFHIYHLVVVRIESVWSFMFDSTWHQYSYACEYLWFFILFRNI